MKIMTKEEKLLEIISCLKNIIQMYREHTADSVTAGNLSKNLRDEVEKLENEVKDESKED